MVVRFWTTEHFLATVVARAVFRDGERAVSRDICRAGAAVVRGQLPDIRTVHFARGV